MDWTLLDWIILVVVISYIGMIFSKPWDEEDDAEKIEAAKRKKRKILVTAGISIILFVIARFL